jgi:hypothetical protein
MASRSCTVAAVLLALTTTAVRVDAQAASATWYVPSASAAANAEFEAARNAYVAWAFGRGEAHLVRALELDPEFAAPRVMLNWIRYYGSEAPQARDAVARAVADAAKGPPAQAAWALAMREATAANVAAARPLFDAALALSGGDFFIALERADYLADAARAQALRELARAHPIRPEPRLWLAYRLTVPVFGVEPAAMEEALHVAHEAVRLAPDVAGTHVALAHVLQRALRHEEAREALRTAATLPDASPYMHHLLAEMALRDGDLPGARAELGRAIRTFPIEYWKATYRQYMALTWAHGGDLARAAAELGALGRQQEAEGQRLAARDANGRAALLYAAADDTIATARHLAAMERLGATPTSLADHAVLAAGLAGQAPRARQALDAYIAATAGAPGIARDQAIQRHTGWVLLAENRPAEAMDALRQSGPNPYGQLGIVVAYEKLGDNARFAEERARLLAIRDFSMATTAMAIARARYSIRAE